MSSTLGSGNLNSTPLVNRATAFRKGGIDRASSSITGYAGDAGDLAKRASDQIAEKLGRDPWLIGIVGFVGGALLAAVLPPTQTEQNLVGQAQGELRNRAAELGHEAAARVRELADAAIRPSPH